MGEKVTIWLKTCFRTWNSKKSKKLRALLEVATGNHFQDPKLMILLKDPRLSLASFYAAGPFVPPRSVSREMFFDCRIRCPIWFWWMQCFLSNFVYMRVWLIGFRITQRAADRSEPQVLSWILNIDKKIHRIFLITLFAHWFEQILFKRNIQKVS